MRQARGASLDVVIRGSPSSTLFPYTTLFRSVLRGRTPQAPRPTAQAARRSAVLPPAELRAAYAVGRRSEEHTSELQSQANLVCRLLLVKNKLTVIPSRLVYVTRPTLLSRSGR